MSRYTHYKLAFIVSKNDLKHKILAPPLLNIEKAYLHDYCDVSMQSHSYFYKSGVVAIVIDCLSSKLWRCSVTQQWCI